MKVHLLCFNQISEAAEICKMEKFSISSENIKENTFKSFDILRKGACCRIQKPSTVVDFGSKYLYLHTGYVLRVDLGTKRFANFLQKVFAKWVCPQFSSCWGIFPDFLQFLNPGGILDFKVGLCMHFSCILVKYILPPMPG